MSAVSLAGRALAAVSLGAAALVVPAAATPALAAPVLAEDVVSTCEVTGGELTWGVKESFRSYITTIAAGSWEVSEGAAYETPSFIFSGATGSVDATTGEGSISFPGTVHFTGHEGVLDLTLANPTVEFTGDGTGRLLVDTSSNNDQGELVVDTTQVSFGKIDSIGAIDPSSGSLTLADAPVVLTAEGADAFSGYYSSGESLDPINLSVQLTECGSADPAPEVTTQAPEEPVDDTAAPTEEQADFPWVPVIAGAVALMVIGVAVGMLIAGRKKTQTDIPDAAAPEDPTP